MSLVEAGPVGTLGRGGVNAWSRKGEGGAGNVQKIWPLEIK